MAKRRLDVAIMELGLAESRQKAQALIMAGEVYVNGQKQLKAGASLGDDDTVEVRTKHLLRYVSRGGLKLEKAMWRSWYMRWTWATINWTGSCASTPR